MSGIIGVRNLSFGYTAQRRILQDISFEVSRGTFVGIAGPNGAGKSTLLNLLCGKLAVMSGIITIDSEAIESYSAAALAKKIAVVRQEFVPAFGFSVLETVMMARTLYYGTLGFESSTDRQIVMDALEATETAQFAARPLESLSGGERQLVFIARALAQNTDILLLDEPTNFLDIRHQVGIYDLLRASQLEKGKTIVAVTHDINLAAQYCDKVLLLRADGEYRYGSAGEVLLADQIAEAFGVQISAGTIGAEQFFIPVGKFTRRTSQTSRNGG